MGSVLVAPQPLEPRLSSCGTWLNLPCGIWHLPRPGTEPVSPALEGGFLITGPQGKPYWWLFCKERHWCLVKWCVKRPEEELLPSPQKESERLSPYQWRKLHVSRERRPVTCIKSSEWLVMPSCGRKDPSSKVLDLILKPGNYILPWKKITDVSIPFSFITLKLGIKMHELQSPFQV